MMPIFTILRAAVNGGASAVKGAINDGSIADALREVANAQAGAAFNSLDMGAAGSLEDSNLIAAYISLDSAHRLLVASHSPSGYFSSVSASLTDKFDDWYSDLRVLGVMVVVAVGLRDSERLSYALAELEASLFDQQPFGRMASIRLRPELERSDLHPSSMLKNAKAGVHLLGAYLHPIKSGRFAVRSEFYSSTDDRIDDIEELPGLVSDALAQSEAW